MERGVSDCPEEGNGPGQCRRRQNLYSRTYPHISYHDLASIILGTSVLVSIGWAVNNRERCQWLSINEIIAIVIIVWDTGNYHPTLQIIDEESRFRLVNGRKLRSHTDLTASSSWSYSSKTCSAPVAWVARSGGACLRSGGGCRRSSVSSRPDGFYVASDRIARVTYWEQNKTKHPWRADCHRKVISKVIKIAKTGMAKDSHPFIAYLLESDINKCSFRNYF